VIICHCKAVTHKEIEAAIDAGAECAADVVRLCGAGGGCGACIAVIRLLVEARRDDEDPVDPPRLIKAA
jgi:bacterioferritin-associated ferredoxin